MFNSCISLLRSELQKGPIDSHSEYFTDTSGLSTTFVLYTLLRVANLHANKDRIQLRNT